MRGRRLNPNYNLDEVEALAEGYEELSVKRSKLWLLVRYCDFDTAIKKMPQKYYEAVLLIGLIGLDTRTAGKLLGCANTTAWRRYQRGIEWLHKEING